MSRSDASLATSIAQTDSVVLHECSVPQASRGGDEPRDPSVSTAAPIESSTNSEPSKLRSFVVVATICGVPLLNTMQSGFLTVGLPSIASDLQLTRDLLLWPASVYALSCGCSLLLFGSIADVIGARPMYLFGCATLALSTLASALAGSGLQLILFRAISGLAISCCLPSTVSIVTSTFEPGKSRSVAFACLGAAQPTGFSLGLVLGGVLVDSGSAGWRLGFYMGFGTNLLMLLAAIFVVPKEQKHNDAHASLWRRLTREVDWIGNLLSSTAMILLSYVFAMVTSSTVHIRAPQNIVLLLISVILIVTFIFWQRQRERHGLPTLMPNSLWGNKVFSTVCFSVFLCWASMTAFQFFVSLYFQNLEQLSAVQTSLRLVPMVVAGGLMNVLTGWLVSKVSANVLVSVAAVTTALSSLFMALNEPDWPYWYMSLAAIFFSPLSADVLFTVSNLVITSVFPPKTHAVAGGVFNTVSQIGNSVGLALGAVVASSVTINSEFPNKTGEAALLKGYRATFWMCFGTTIAMLVISHWGLKGIGKVGIKRD